MYPLIYGVISSVTVQALRLARVFNTRIDQFLDERSTAPIVSPSKRKFWIHCASHGEFEMAIPVIQNLLESHKLEDILITFFSPNGFRPARSSRYAESCMYLPLDDPMKVNRFYRVYKPEIAIFIRYDLWFNFINQGLARGTQFYLINTRFNKKHKIFKIFGSPYLKLLKRFERIFCSDRETCLNLEQRSFNNTEYTGDIRFDRVYQNSKEVQNLESIAAFKGNDQLMVIGSSWQKEEELLEYLLSIKPKGLKFIIAPHNIHESRILEIEERFKDRKIERYTRSEFGPNDEIVIFNTIGLLSKVYHYADFALVGGGFTGKLHNILEPAVFGCHISYGSEINKFPEAEQFAEAGFGYIVHDTKKWAELIEHLLQNRTELERIHLEARKYVENNLGANLKIMAQLNN